ncbi:hypothetical protein [Clostridium botulinum]|uniref:hypothetical protein n=1 Tax=Clostridium botulinum TaxID=1491 RepID=UPI0007733F88|nr:hypothetical protein [Clostridium botulinum]APH20889.1 hypothetical protein NPD1_4322 [Clostridium botulinum]APQ71134.1 hypothetical protein RSJ8_4279 [Clostridium botulinum]MBN3379133.1 hypothetical protein [Clostridium botulinum]
MTNDKIDLKDGIYIPNIEACWIYKENLENGDYKVQEKYLDKLLNGKLDSSHELIQNEVLVNNINIKKINGKLYTLDVINIKYNNKYKEKNTELTTKDLRDWTYKNGFVFSGNKLTNWKRSSGKARQGENLFLLDNIKNECLLWARMGLEFEEKEDVASVRAYESLPLSSVIGTIEIDPNSILVIKDFESEFPWRMSKTYLKNKELITETETIKECNSIRDGEALLDVSIFNENELIKGKGMALLRNRLTKSCAFNTNIQQFIKDWCVENNKDYETYEVEDICHNKIKVKDIKLITTPSSIKLAKFNKKVLKKEGYKHLKQNAWLKYYKDNCGKIFSVCKYEKPSKFDNGKYNRLSYQMVNTIPLTKQDIKNLVKHEIKYVEKLKDNLDFFMQEVNQDIESTTEIEDIIIDDEELKIGRRIDVCDAFIQLVKINPLFQNTQVFKDYRRNFINSYIKDLRRGKIRVEGDYCTICSNPIEMLYAVFGQFKGDSITLTKNEIYCPRFKNDEKVVGFRNPHVVTGNIANLINKKNNTLSKYMNCTDNIVIINSIKYPILTILQGADMDSDTLLLTNNKIIVDACEKIDWSNTPIPVNCVENTGKNNCEMTGENMSDIDHIISQNYIGSVINLSQEINSLLNHLKYNNKATEEDLKKWYDKSSRLSSISCVEIDKAKKQFKDLNVPKELEKMKVGLPIVDKKKVEEINEEIKSIKNNLKKTEIQVKKYRKEKRKPINEEIRKLKKELNSENNNKTLNKINQLKSQIEDINLEKEEDVKLIKNQISLKYKELRLYDTRRVKPYFFKYIGDTKAQKKKRKINKKHKNELDKNTIAEYAKTKNIKINEVNKNDKNLIKLLKENNKIQKEWEEKIYDYNIDTPMNWLQKELDGIKNSKKNGTIQVIQLIKRNTNDYDDKAVKQVIKLLKNTYIKIKGYRTNGNLNITEKRNKIRYVKNDCIKKIRKIKIKKSEMYHILSECLTSIRKVKNKKTNKTYYKVNKKSDLESLTLEILFETYGKGLLNMFQTDKIK